MKPPQFIIPVIVIILILFIFRARKKFSNSEPDTNTKRPSSVTLSTQQKQNDKIVLVKGVSQSDLQRVITGFCNMNNKESFQAQPRLSKLTEREFAITFPYDIDFEIFCYFINYVKYPMELKWAPDITAWCTTKSGDTWIAENTANKKVMLFIPADDTEYDNVYMTTENNIGYKLGFAIGEEMQLLDSAKKPYRDPEVNLPEFSNLEFKDFK